MGENSTLVIYATSQLFDCIFDIITWIIFILSTLLLSCLIWAIITKSPKEMGIYKWYLAVNFICIYMLEIFSGFFHPRFIFPIPGIVFDGVLKYFPVHWGNYYYIFTDFITIIIIVYVYVIMLMFIYRYIQTVGTESSANHFLVTKFIEIETKLLQEKPKIGFIFHVLIVGTVGSIFIWSFSSYFISDTELKDLYKECCPDVYESIKDRTVIGFKNMPIITAGIIFAVILGVIVEGILVKCLIYHSLLQLKKSLRPETYSLYIKLINILLLELLIYVISAGVPAVLYTILYQYKFKYSNVIGSCCILLVYLEPLIIGSITILYVKCYKRAIQRLLQRIFKYKNSSTTQPTVNQVSSVARGIQIQVKSNLSVNVTNKYKTDVRRISRATIF